MEGMFVGLSGEIVFSAAMEKAFAPWSICSVARLAPPVNRKFLRFKADLLAAPTQHAPTIENFVVASEPGTGPEFP
jgi:hypothetical protein